MNVRTAAAILIWALAVPSGSAAAPQAAAGGGLDLPVVHYRLKNGLQVILSADDTLPVVSVVVGYAAGSLHEKPGRAGLAYLVENLMFQGSENVGPMQHVNAILSVGGRLNADTGHDRTLFHQTVPSNRLPLVLWLESDRMRAPSVTAATVDRVRNGLLAELRQRTASEPYLRSYDLLDELLFGDFSYGHPLSGSEEALNAITVEDVIEFRAARYVPNNAVLCIAGDIGLTEARELVARYFDTIPAGRSVDPLPAPPPAPEGSVQRVLEDALASAHGFQLGFRMGRLQTGDSAALRVLEYVLMRGPISRLPRRLLRRDRTALFLTGGLERRGGGYAFKLFTTNNNAVMVDRCRKAVFEEIERLKTDPVSESELARAKVRFRTDILSRFSVSLDRALYLTEAHLAGIGPDEIGRDFESCLRVGPSTLQNLVSRHFRAEASVGIMVTTK